MITVSTALLRSGNWQTAAEIASSSAVDDRNMPIDRRADGERDHGNPRDMTLADDRCDFLVRMRKYDDVRQSRISHPFTMCVLLANRPIHHCALAVVAREHPNDVVNGFRFRSAGAFYDRAHVVCAFLKAWKIRMAKIAVMNVHATELGAASERGYGLAGIEQALLVERSLDAAKAFELRRRELRAHATQFFHANAMLARDRAADFNAQRQNLIAECDRTFLVAGLVGVEQDQRMQIAVTGVEHVRAGKAVFRRPRGDLPQHVRKRSARNGAVDAIVVRCNTADRRKRGLAARPI